MIRKINSENDYPLIVSERGRGYKLNTNSRHDLEKEQQKGTDNRSSINISPVERRNRILKRLLLVSPQGIKESDVFQEYFVSSNVRTNDERVMKQILERYDLKLEIKHGYMRIKGPEVNIRHVIKELIDDREIVNLSQFSGNKDFNSKYDVNFVLREIEKVEDKLQTTLPYPYNVNLFSHMYILINRLRNAGNYADINRPQIKNSDIIGKTYLYQISQEIVKDISNYLHKPIPKNEADTFLEYLASSRFDDDSMTEKVSTNVSSLTQQLVEKVSEKTGCSFVGILNNLEKHMEPLIHRLENDIHVNNNLLEQIRMEYGDLFDAIKEVSSKVFRDNGLSTPDDNEVGYLTLYFAQAIENQPRKLNIVIMCSTGIGTSELLKIKVQNVFPNFNVVAVTSNNDLSVNKDNVDLIISTVRVSKKIKVPSVIVSALFTTKDQEAVEKAVDKISGK